MKRALCIVLFSLGPCLAAPSAPALVQDRLDTPSSPSALAQRSLLNGVALAGRRLVAVGQRGHILISEDGSKSWNQVAVPVSSDLTAVYFASPLKGWAVGHDGVVLVSADGGRSWAKQLDGRAVVKILLDRYVEHPPAGMSGGEDLAKLVKRFATEGPDKPFLDVWFDDESVGYIVGPFGLILRTADGGKSWVPWLDRTDNPNQLNFYAVRRVGADLYLSGEQGMVLKLDRSAERFRSVSVDYKGTLFAIAGNERALLVLGQRGSVFRSDDGGSSWVKVETGLPVAFTSATFLQGGRLALVSQAGDVLVSTDGAKTFTRAPIERPIPAGAVVSPAADRLVTVGPFGANALALKP